MEFRSIEYLTRGRVATITLTGPTDSTRSTSTCPARSPLR